MYLTPQNARHERGVSQSGSKISASKNFQSLTHTYDQLRTDKDQRNNSYHSRYQSPSIARKSGIIQIDKNQNQPRTFDFSSKIDNISKSSTPKNKINGHSQKIDKPKVCEGCFNKRLANVKRINKDTQHATEQIQQDKINNANLQNQQDREQQDQKRKNTEKKIQQNYYQIIQDEQTAKKQKKEQEIILADESIKKGLFQEQQQIKQQQKQKSEMLRKHNQDLLSQINYKRQLQEQDRIRSTSNIEAPYWKFIGNQQAEHQKRIDSQQDQVNKSWQIDQVIREQKKLNEKQNIIHDQKIMSQADELQKIQQKEKKEFENRKKASLQNYLQKQIIAKVAKKEEQTNYFNSQQKGYDEQFNHQQQIRNQQIEDQREKTKSYFAVELKHQIMDKEKKVQLQQAEEKVKDRTNQVYQQSKIPVQSKSPCGDCTKSFPDEKLSVFL